MIVDFLFVFIVGFFGGSREKAFILAHTVGLPSTLLKKKEDIPR